MSTLTKVLIVLQVVFSVFLCGIVVTYVANATDFKKDYDRANSSLRSSEQRAAQAEKDKDKFIEEKKTEFADALTKITAQDTAIATLTAERNRLQVENTGMTAQVAKMSSTVTASATTSSQYGEQLKNRQSELTMLERAHTAQTKDLEETNDALMEKMAIVSTQTEKIRRLTEEKTELQTMLDQYNRQYGKTVPTTSPVTSVHSKARLAPITAPNIGLKGSIAAIDLKNHLAEISLGSAHGIKEEMKFRVTRGDQYVCDILVLEVDAEQSVGVLDMIQVTPRIGDKIVSNF